jgi:hypothetical protein
MSSGPVTFTHTILHIFESRKPSITFHQETHRQGSVTVESSTINSEIKLEIRNSARNRLKSDYFEILMKMA